MKHIATIFGTAIAGIFVMSVWGKFAGAYGIGGGWFAGFLIIGTMWYLNHVIGLHNNDGAWVDMALGIGTVGLTMGIFNDGIAAGTAAIPTLVVVCIGGAAGGLCAYLVEKTLAADASVE